MGITEPSNENKNVFTVADRTKSKILYNIKTMAYVIFFVKSCYQNKGYSNVLYLNILTQKHEVINFFSVQYLYMKMSSVRNCGECPLSIGSVRHSQPCQS